MVNIKEIVENIQKLGNEQYKELWERTNVLGIQVEEARQVLKKNWFNSVKLFLGNYAFQRGGAPRLYSAVAVHIAEEIKNINVTSMDQKDITCKCRQIMRDFVGSCESVQLTVNKNYKPKEDKNFFAQLLAWVKVCLENNNTIVTQIVQDFRHGNGSDCFEKLVKNSNSHIPNIGDKIIRFFLRDIIWIFWEEFDKERKDEIKKNEYIQPVDVNLARLVSLLWRDEEIKEAIGEEKQKKIKKNSRRMPVWSENQIRQFILKKVGDVIKEPIQFNQGGWYLLAHPSEPKCQEIMNQILDLKGREKNLKKLFLGARKTESS